MFYVELLLTEVVNTIMSEFDNGLHTQIIMWTSWMWYTIHCNL